MKLSDLKPDTKNANKGTKRGRDSVSASLSQFGAGRSILIDRDGNIIAGNTTAQQAADSGLELTVIKTDGSQLVAVQRTDLSIDDPKARGLAIADNRTSELGLEWNPEILGELSADLDLKAFFTDDELADVLGLTSSAGDESAASDQSDSLKDAYSVLVTCSDEASQLALLERLTSEGFECRSLIA